MSDSHFYKNDILNESKDFNPILKNFLDKVSYHSNIYMNNRISLSLLNIIYVQTHI
jgi:hypothetical protein